jgi:hypothetical protein
MRISKFHKEGNRANVSSSLFHVSCVPKGYTVQNGKRNGTEDYGLCDACATTQRVPLHINTETCFDLNWNVQEPRYEAKKKKKKQS